jgi:hypothetical protein
MLPCVVFGYAGRLCRKRASIRYFTNVGMKATDETTRRMFLVTAEEEKKDETKLRARLQETKSLIESERLRTKKDWEIPS